MRASPSRPLIVLGVLTMLLVVITGCSSSPPPSSVPPPSPPAPPARTVPQVAPDPFYDPPATLPAGDGDVIRSAPVTVPFAARAVRLMYRSTDVDGRPVAVTGTVLLPLAPPPGPLPLISYAPGTQGLADRCAPSHQFPEGTEYESLSVAALVGRGAAVAVTDYEGLGTPGEHTYVIRAAEAHAVLDIARAATRLGIGVPPDGAVALAGYSQGGGASAAAAELAPEYAPELRLVGAYVGAAPADLPAVATYLDGRPSGALMGYAISGIDAAYPALGVPGLLNDRGRAFLAEIRGQCVDETTARFPNLRTAELTKDGRSLGEELATSPVAADQQIGNRTPRIPVLIAHSPTDDIVPFDQDRDLARRWCARGATVTFTPIAAPTHTTAAAVAFPGALAWLQDRFAGRPVTPACP